MKIEKQKLKNRQKWPHRASGVMQAHPQKMYKAHNLLKRKTQVNDKILGEDRPLGEDRRYNKKAYN